MKNFRTHLIILITYAVSSCSLGASMPQQITSLNVDCDADAVQITDEIIDLNGEESWIAQCGNKVYSCTYLPESGSDCYELHE